MAIYHLEAKVVSRGAGRSAVAASAYLSCSRLYNDYDGIQHDYTRKQGLVWQQIFLPEYAPQEWQDREKLWNAVEEVETAKDSRLAREFVVALPIELSREQQIELLQDFIREQFVADGMCADAAIHDTDGHNPHAHILLTVRPLDGQGHWQYKTEKEYLCVRNGEEKGFTAAEFKSAQSDGWEKQYPYKVGKKKVYMTPSAAETQGLVRADKHPKSTRYGRQNPISERWNSEEQLAIWRAAWADVSNRYLERAGQEERIDHRSNAARGIDEIPTIHEGVTAQALERKGIISDRCEINRQIKADNALLRELKAAVKKLGQAVKNTIPVIAEAMEKLLANMIVLHYQLRHIGLGKQRMKEYMPIGNYQFEISIQTGGLFKRAKEVVAVGDCIIGDKNLLRFMNRRIVVESITDEFKEEAGHILIRPCYIDQIQYCGMEDTSEGYCPVYSGILYTTGYHGERYEFSYDVHTNKKGITKMLVNPVRIVYISNTALCITDPDGDGLYYYNYYDRSLESVVFALTDHEYTKANKQKYSNADLYSYRTERV